MGVMTSAALGLMTVAGAATSAVGQIKSGNSANQAMQYNAKVAEQAGKAAETSAEFEAFKINRAAQRLAGQQRAGYAASGVTQSGTPLLVELESASEAEMDMMIARWNGKVKVAQAGSQAAYDRMVGANYASAGKTGAFATLLQTTGQAGLQHFGTGAKATKLPKGKA